MKIFPFFRLFVKLSVPVRLSCVRFPALSPTSCAPVSKDIAFFLSFFLSAGRPPPFLQTVPDFLELHIPPDPALRRGKFPRNACFPVRDVI